MREKPGNYLHKRPYRKKLLFLAEGKYLINIIEDRFSAPFNSYWERFGYEIGGPVCYGYVKWILDQIEQNHSDISGLAFVARDGWLLQKVYDILPHKSEINSHYIYAPRAVKQICQSNKEKHAMYRKYLSEQVWGSGVVAVIDTVTMKFSSQQLISSSINRKTHGFFWLVLDGEKDYGRGLSYSTYQAVRHHTIKCWNIMEFIMTSPEPPICAMEGDKPCYRTSNRFEKTRAGIFMEIEKGVLSFVSDLCSSGGLPSLTNKFLTAWVNDFLDHPDQEDILAFEPVMFSEREDHSDCVSLDPFGKSGLSAKKLKDRLWLFSQKHKYLYQLLHAGNAGWKKIKTWFRGTGYIRFDGGRPWELADKLSEYDVISFDIFDTLILRKVNRPTDLFYQIERETGQPGFHDKRVQAEMDARQRASKVNGEVDIFDIYRELSQHSVLDVEQSVKKEFEAEKKSCFANPAMEDVYRLLVEKGCRMIAVSDMYLPGKYLRQLLDECGFGNIEQVFVSCDYGVGKSDGALQKRVQSEFEERLRFIHIGDNFESDVKGSETAGWGAIWYCKKTS